MTKPTFSDEFKREAAELITLKYYSYAKACEARGISESALRRWVKQLEGELAGITPVGARAITEGRPSRRSPWPRSCSGWPDRQRPSPGCRARRPRWRDRARLRGRT